jgi:hypothetical protein
MQDDRKEVPKRVDEKRPRRHPILGTMKELTTIAPGVDVTEPAMPEWADLIDEEYGKADSS